MSNQEIINHLIEDLGFRQERLLERMQEGDHSRRAMESDLKEIIKLNKQLSEFNKENK